MTDRELLELAAKAAGIEDLGAYGHMRRRDWNPLTDDGDALRLAVRLHISIEYMPIGTDDKRIVFAKKRMRSDLLRQKNPTHAAEHWQPDPLAATRRAIVRAAAEIGRTM